VVALRAVLALALLLGTTPGVVELVEDGAHWVLDGHTDHAEGETPCPEHGCTPTSHQCGCCVGLQLAHVGARVVVPRAPAGESSWIPSTSGAPRPGVTRGLFRPPAA
jgi:hypothetical protein